MYSPVPRVLHKRRGESGERRAAIASLAADAIEHASPATFLRCQRNPNQQQLTGGGHVYMCTCARGMPHGPGMLICICIHTSGADKQLDL